MSRRERPLGSAGGDRGHHGRRGRDAARPPSRAEGSYFSDGDRASGVFGVLATGFSVLLGFILFLAFTSYDQSRTGAGRARRSSSCSRSSSAALPAAAAAALTGQLLCYGRSVVHDEWPRMEDGTEGDA